MDFCLFRKHHISGLPQNHLERWAGSDSFFAWWHICLLVRLSIWARIRFSVQLFFSGCLSVCQHVSRVVCSFEFCSLVGRSITVSPQLLPFNVPSTGSKVYTPTGISLLHHELAASLPSDPLEIAIIFCFCRGPKVFSLIVMAVLFTTIHLNFFITNLWT